MRSYELERSYCFCAMPKLCYFLLRSRWENVDILSQSHRIAVDSGLNGARQACPLRDIWYYERNSAYQYSPELFIRNNFLSRSNSLRSSPGHKNLFQPLRLRRQGIFSGTHDLGGVERSQRGGRYKCRPRDANQIETGLEESHWGSQGECKCSQCEQKGSRTGLHTVRSFPWIIYSHSQTFINNFPLEFYNMPNSFLQYFKTLKMTKLSFCCDVTSKIWASVDLQGCFCRVSYRQEPFRKGATLSQVSN